MAGPKITDLTEMTDTPASSDVLYLVDVSGPSDRKITYNTLQGPTSTKTANYTITKNGEKVFAAGTITITLPAASYGWNEKVFNVGAGKITIAPAGSDTIEGRNSIVLGKTYDAAELEGDGGTLWVRS